MKIALIPPKGYELQALRGTAIMSLCIPSFFSSFAWSGAVRQSKVQPGDYLHILDNGAAEGETADQEVLINYAHQLGVDECVVPDVLGDCEGTIKRAKFFFAAPPVGFSRMNWMVVLQGQNEAEMLKVALSQVSNPAVGTLGIPRIYINSVGQLNARTDLANKIEHKFPGRFQIHFLGVHPAYPGEIRVAAKYTTARSLDTSLPFNATIAGIELNDKTRQVSRPKGYFTDTRFLDEDLLKRNVDTVLRWANGKRASTSASAS